MLNNVFIFKQAAWYVKENYTTHLVIDFFSSFQSGWSVQWADSPWYIGPEHSWGPGADRPRTGSGRLQGQWVMLIKSQIHRAFRTLYDSASHRQSCEQTPHTTQAECWAPRLAHAYFTFCHHSKCAIWGPWPITMVWQVLSTRLVPRANYATGKLRSWWHHTCVTIPVEGSYDWKFI